MEERLKRLKRIFEPKSIAIIGASNTPAKVGNVILKNFIEGNYTGKIYPVNPKYDKITNMKCYASVDKITGRIDCAIIATPAETIPKILEECGRKGVGGAIILSGGFEEVKEFGLAGEIKKISEKYKMPVIGPNCLGVYNPYTKVDSIFLPMYKLERPVPGRISFVTQSGAVGSAIIDMAAQYNIGIAKFISYGNATVLDESDYLKYLEHDKKTKVIILYIEGTKDGKKLLKQLIKTNRKKPIIVLKAGRYGKAQEAARSHTGNIAGNYMAYQAAFRQAKVIEAEGIDEVFDFVKIFAQTRPQGKKIGIITNGGGLGVLTTDAVEEEELEIAGLSEQTKKDIKKILPSYGNVANPLDLVADASVESYRKVIEIFMRDPGIDIMVIIILMQTPPMDERIIDVVVNASNESR